VGRATVQVMTGTNDPVGPAPDSADHDGEAQFGPHAQTDSILAVTDQGRRFHGNGMTPVDDHADWRITMEAPL